MTRIRGKPRPPGMPALRLSAEGHLRRCILLGLGLSAASSGFLPAAAEAAQFGSPAWFAQQQAGGVPAGSTAPSTTAPSGINIPAVTTPSAALIHAQRSMANLNRAAEAIVNAQAAQAAARQLALGAINTVPDGLAPGGLVIAPGAAADAANPQGCAPTNTCVWQNANLPSQSVADGKTTVKVEQTAKKAILTWDSFNIGKQTTLNFDQHRGTQSDGSNDWVALNRVNPGASPSQILGQIKAQGSVYIINQNGIIFGGASQVNVHSLLASTLPLYLQNAPTTLTPGNDADYLRFSNNLFLNTGISSIGTGTASGNILGIGSGQTIALSNLTTLPQDIRIDAGASIATNALGYSLIAAPNVYNAGTISATDGQVILAAGLGVSLKNPAAGSLLLQPVLSGRVNDDAHGNADATPRSQLVNSGLISSRRGDVRMMGFSIEQRGVVAATTSVTRPGSINIVAEDEQATDSAQARTGSLKFTSGSVTAILPDGNDETTISSPAANQIFKPGSMSLIGGSVTFKNGSLVEAPGQNVTVAAIGINAVTRSGLNDGSITGRVYLDDGAIIDVSGLADVELAMAANQVTIPRLGQNELADTPVQRDGVLFGVPITIDMRNSGTRSDGVAWTGTPLANVGGYVQQVPRKIGQLLQNGGIISLTGGEVITHTGSQLNLDGGYLHYLGGTIETTRLIAANGAIFDIGSADPNIAYIGIAGRFNDAEPRWNNTTTYINPLIGGQGGVYESEYIHGGNAGTLNVYGHTTAILDGDISAQAYAGRHQVASGKMPAGGKYFAGAGAGNSLELLAFPDLTLINSGPSYVVQDESPDLSTLVPGFDANTALPVFTAPATDTSNFNHWVPVSANKLAEAGFWSVTVVADDATQTNQGGEVVVAQGSGLAVRPGGTISLTGSRVSIYGDLTAAAGTINVTTTGNTSVIGSTPRPQASTATPASGDIVVGAGVELNARGQWINDAGLDQDSMTGGAFVNGGNISLRTLQHGISSTQSGASCGGAPSCVTDTTGSIVLGSGSLLDVSSGGRVLPSGQVVQKDGIVQGKGGSISLLTYATADSQFGSSEQLPLPTDGPLDNGHIELGGVLRGYGFSGGGVLSLRALGIQIGDSPVAAPDWVLDLPAGFFSDQGFASYVLSAEYDATITAGTTVTPVQANLLPNYQALLEAATGADLYATDVSHPEGLYASIGRLDSYHRQATDFSLYAGDYLNWRVGTGVIPDYSAAGITGTALLARGASILADAGAHVTIGSDNQVTVNGSIIAHGGAITLTGDTGNGGYAQVPGLITNGNAYTAPGKSVWLGAASLLDVSGVSLVNPLQPPLLIDGETVVPRTGRVLNGGSVTITNDTGYIIALSCRDANSCSDPTAPGARINVSGASDVYQLKTTSPTNSLQSQDVWSDAGSITLGAGAGLFYDGQFIAHGGSDSARGGTLTITPEITRLGTTSGFEGAERLVIRKHPGALPVAALQPGQPLVSGSALPSGVLRFGVDRLNDSGIDSLVLGVNPQLTNAIPAVPIAFTRDVSISMARSIIANASSFIGVLNNDGVSHVQLSAPYVSLHGYVPGGIYPNVGPLPATTPGMTLTVTANTIDLGGQFSLRNFGLSEFISSGDIRFLTPSSYDYYRSINDLTSATAVPGVLLASGDLTFQAAQIYPATGNRFIIDDMAPASTVTFLGNERSSSARTPISAGGSLLVNAANIIQSGVLRAPAGQIVLGVSDPSDPASQALFSYLSNNRRGDPTTILLPLIRTDSVRLTDGSLTSVSLDGLIVPYGQTVDGQNWQYNGSATSSSGSATTVPNLTAPPGKSIVLNGGNVELNEGANIDLSGGGDLQAQEWVAGTGGSRDVLLPVNTVFSGGQPQQVPLYADGRQVYAIIPGYSGSPAAYDPAIVAGDPLIGQAVYLSGMPGLPAGVYTLLPAKYATIPGAYRVVQDTSSIDALASQNTTMPDGTQRVAGQFVDTLSGAHDARTTSFFVQSGEVWQQYSQYTLSSANKFFKALAEHTGTVTPRLPLDAGQLVLAATNTLTLGATLNTTAVPGGVGALVDIASQHLQIVDANAVALPDYVQVRAADLDTLNASSLLIGGTRTRTAEGDLITAFSSNVLVSNGDETLMAPEIILVAKASQAGDGVTIGAGSTIQAVGEIQANQDVPIIIGQLPQTGTGNQPDTPGVSGDGALLRVSNGAPVTVNRINVPGSNGVPGSAFGVLKIEAGASIRGDASITLDSAANTLVDPTAEFSARAIDANSGLISFVGENATGGTPSGLIVSAQTLAQFANAQQVSLSSRGAMEFLGDVDISLANALNLNAGVFSSDGGAVSIHAKTLTLANELNAPAPAASGGTGSLELTTEQLNFGAGDKALSGFGSVAANAGKGIVMQGKGSFDLGTATIALHAPILLADTGALNSLETSGAFTLDSQGAAGQPLSASPLGGTVKLTGGTLSVDTRIQAEGGKVDLTATDGDLTLGTTAIIDVKGQEKQFFETKKYADGGVISLASNHGDVIVGTGSQLDYSANAGGGDAGKLQVSANEGAAQLNGTIKGSAADGQLGGSLDLDVHDGADLDALVALLSAGGIDHQVSVRTTTGNLLLSSTGVLRADQVTLNADGGAGGVDANNGNVIVLGSIDASGEKGGEISLFGRSGVDIQGKLLAQGSATNKRGGSVVIGTAGVGAGSVDATYGFENISASGSGIITMGPDAVIDVSGGSAGGLSGGTVTVRAPLLSNGDVQVFLDPATQVIGARDFSLEAFATWATTDSGTGPHHFDGIIDPAGGFDAQGEEDTNPDHANFYQQTLKQFVQAPGFIFENRFAGVTNFHARPGIDLVNADTAVNGGNISVLSDWNLGAGTRDANGTLHLDYRYANGTAPVLTLRAVHDVNVNASISDGFFQNNNPFNASNPGDTDNSASPVATDTNPLPLLTAGLAASYDPLDLLAALVPVDSTSYRIVAGADTDSADPASLQTATQSGDVSLNNHQYAYFDKRNGSSVAVVSPTMIRTGTGSITIAAAHDVAMLDPVAPGVIYTAGRPAAGTTGLPTSTVIDSTSGLPVVVDTGNVHPEAAGNISIRARNDVIGIERVIDDGTRTGRADTNLSQFWWPWMQRNCIFTSTCATAPDGSSVDYGVFDQGILSVGGDINVSAGRDVRDLSASTVTTWYLTSSGTSTIVNTAGGGDLNVSAGRDVLSGAYFVAKGEGRITAGRDIRADLEASSGNPLSTLLALQDALLHVSAVQSVDIGGVYNPSYMFRNFDSQSYSERSSLTIIADSGNVTLERTSGEFNFGSRGGLGVAYPFVLPASVDITALNGGITVNGNGELYPSPGGQLSLIADGTIRLFNANVNNTFFGLIDAPASVLPSPLHPIFGGAINSSFIDNGANSNFDLHSLLALHAQDSQPVRIYSVSGSIIDGTDSHQGALIIDVSKPALIHAGVDIVNLTFRGQNLYASDVTQIRAGRDLYDAPLAPQQSVAYIELGGPGTLDIQAGRDVGPITSANDALNLGYLRPNDATYPGIRTVGNQNNAYLPREGASISVIFGTAPGVALQSFTATYLDPAVTHDPNDPADTLGTPDYSRQLAAFVEQYETDQLKRSGQQGAIAGLTPQQAWADFQLMPEYQQERFVYSVFFDILNRTGLDFNNPDSRFTQQYARGFQAINTLFPAALGYTANDLSGGANGAQTTVSTGTFDMRGSTVQTQNGGNISILGPGGDVLVGSVSAPPVVPASQFTAGIGPNNQGILTLEQGAVSIFTDRSVLLAQSRIFTEQGGDVLIWSSNGDINAGKGAKTSSEIPPPEFLCDPDHFCLVDAKSQVSGAGIAVLQTKIDAPSGTANLIAPRGTVDAGDAGIRVSGSLNVAAFKVANADNIQVSGSSVGVPSGLVDIGALGAASSVAASVSQSASQIASSRPQEAAVLAITVEVIGFGTPRE